MPRRKDDGLTKTQRYRLKDLEAYREQKAAYARRPDVREKRRLYMAGWRERNREKHNAAHRAYNKKHGHKHVDRTASYNLKRKFGITLDDKKAMLVAQGGVCLICRVALEIGRRCHVDHCHESGKVRGILCVSCNTRLGWFEKYASGIKTYLGNDVMW